ncbi:AAA family ATPase [Paenibacillus agilis]|uniref:AAA family ATPase n=1 Tax=Paenibacillus agilis TaxID=3020863 RepID=A0A559IWD2_9BACL|nr:AAA family ATPase [Paenibacillus agilis]TVX91940.1 AAA family ATPase [Paenibacillus agilis]
MRRLKQDWVVALPDKQLVERLIDYWKHSKYSEVLQLRVFSQWDTLWQYVKLQPECRLFVVDLDWLNQLEADVETSHILSKLNIFVLTDDPALLQREGVSSATPYQPLDKLFEQGLRQGSAAYEGGSRYSSDSQDINQGQRISSSGACRVVTICSSGGGIGKTTLAFQIAHYAAEMGNKVFYWSLSAHAEWDLFTLSSDKNPISFPTNSFSQLLYSLQRMRTSDLDPSTYTVSIPILRADTFEANIPQAELDALTGERIEQVIHWLKSSKRYDIIVLDVDANLTRNKAAIQISDQLLWVIADDMVQMNKMERCFNYWQSEAPSCYEQLLMKGKIIVNRYMGVMLNRWQRNDLSVDCYLPYIPQWKQLHRPEQWFSSAVYQAALEELIHTHLPWLSRRGWTNAI